MALACLLTALALGGVWSGAFLGQRNGPFSHRLAAAGGGLLSGISLFWLVPEIGEISGRAMAVAIALGMASALALLDRAFMHGGHSAHHGVVWPLLMATCIHSLLDGWSVRLLGLQSLTNVAVLLGLALHKIPEGMAVGWITRRSVGQPRTAFLLSGAAELFTLAGAELEPSLNASGTARFGSWWEAGVLSVIAGGFLFLGVHAVLPAWKRRDVVAIFLTMLLVTGGLTFLRSAV